MNTAIWLADPPGATLAVLDNLGWYCEVANVFIYETNSNSPVKWSLYPGLGHFTLHDLLSVNCPKPGYIK